ncbi:MAG TPA: phosphatase PAP2 family protein [Thermomicrobiales bacterium]|nr:phosphatase PAP2 family protein [Thermomicrobiales bacterium]
MSDLPPGSPLRTSLACIVGGIVALVSLFTLLAEEVVMDGRTWLDRATTIEVRQYATPERTEAVRAATELGSSWLAAIICGSILLWLCWQRRWSTAVAIGGVFFIAKLLETGLKLTFERARPTVVPHLQDAGGYSFPSGHTMTAVITYGLLAAILVGQLNGRARYVPPIMAALIIVTVGFSRVYLGVHYLTDVLAGTLVAGACLILAISALHLLDRPGLSAPVSSAAPGD